MSDQVEKQQGGDALGNASEEVRAEGEGQPDATGANASNRDTVGELMGEVRELGNQIEAAFRAALESERTRQLQRDLMGGLKELSTQVKAAVKNAQENPRVQQASERGLEVIRNAQHSKTAHDLQETLVSGVAQLNMQVRKLVERLETSDTESAGSATPTQHVAVEHSDTPIATGETTRLDEGQASANDPNRTM